MEERDRDLKELSDQELLGKAKDGQNVAFDLFTIGIKDVFSIIFIE